MRLGSSDPSGRGHHLAWSRRVGRPGPTDLVLGVGGDGPDTVLQDGDYWLALTFSERRQFGPLGVVRASRTARPFQVRTSP